MLYRLLTGLVLTCVTVGMLRVPAAQGKEPLRIVMVGDSTMANLTPRPERPDLTGWGQVFGARFTARAVVLNHAASGRSTKTFLNSGLWKKALADRPNVVFIQFGANDSSRTSEKGTDSEGEFQVNLRRFVKETRDTGARPILVTPLSYRTFKGGKAVSSLEPYAKATLRVARELEVQSIDLHQLSLELFQSLGDEGSANLSASATDRTHWSRKGAEAIAKLVADAIPNTVPELGPYLKKE